ncbi:MAG: DUF4402 domain-containing protein [Sphingomicrobium sp.]|nr:DUF4402 domain-containing protein [Sphingomonadales bacterium]
MTNFARTLTAAAVAAAALAATPALAATSATTPATATAQIVKPLVLTAKQNLDFGTIVLANVTANTNVSMSLAGVVTCGTGLTCSGAPKQAIFNVQGSNNQVVHIYSATSTLTGSAGGTLTFTPTLPAGATVTLTTSGVPGNDFNVGGSFVIGTATLDGVYTGNINVTVDYN